MIAKWFSDTMSPWNYGISIFITLSLLVIDQMIGSGTGFWRIQEETSHPSLLFLVGILGLTLIAWSYLDQYILRNFKQGSTYSLLFPTLVMWLFSNHVHELSQSMLMAHLCFVLFFGLWIMFQHTESKIALFGSGLSVGILILHYPVMGFLVGFGLTAIWIWNQGPLRNSLIWLLGCLLPAYYGSAYHYITFQRLPRIPQLNQPEIWLVNRPDGEIPWHLIWLIGAAVLGFLLQLPWFGTPSRIMRLLNLQWIWLMAFLVPVMLVMTGDPWLLLALLAPWGAWHINAFLQWRDGTWIQDLFVVTWMGLVLWGS